MPWIPLYVDDVDRQQLIIWLNDDSEAAFLVTDGPKRWKAVPSLPKLLDATYCIWHVPSGPLPLLDKGTVALEQVLDPWHGWAEKRTGADPTQPYFGAGHPGIIWLDVQTNGRTRPGSIGLSSFGWIGNRYKMLGNGALPATEKWWKRLQRSVKKVATRVPREGPCDGPHPEIWAFPSAHKAFLAGVPRDANNI
jgi:hypothetical protein